MRPFSKLSSAKEIQWSASYHGLLVEAHIGASSNDKKHHAASSDSLDMSKDNHAQAIREIKSDIAANKYTKLVLTREHTRLGSTNATDMFFECVKRYSSAFRYLVSMPDGAVWVGASPELLLERNKKTYKTVSLAGTRPEGQPSWTSKELEEQNIVTKYIVNEVSKAGATEVNVTGPVDIQAGELTHLKSHIKFHFDGEEETMLDALHPTPAVCGAPLDASFNRIADIEPNDRRYYTGFIGLKNDDVSRYFVNLRCAAVYTDVTVFYAGGGITIDSDEEVEWQETERKLNTLRSL
jgi:isochorismate synthase